MARRVGTVDPPLAFVAGDPSSQNARASSNEPATETVEADDAEIDAPADKASVVNSRSARHRPESAAVAAAGSAKRVDEEGVDEDAGTSTSMMCSSTMCSSTSTSTSSPRHRRLAHRRLAHRRLAHRRLAHRRLAHRRLAIARPPRRARRRGRRRATRRDRRRFRSRRRRGFPKSPRRDPPSTPREADDATPTTRDLSGHLKRLPENSTRGLDRCRVRARRVGARRGRAPSRPARASPTSTSTRMKASRPTRMKASRLPSPLDHRPRFRLRDPRRVVGDTADRSRSGRARYTFSDTSDNENRRRPIRRAREIRRNPRRRATPPPRDTARDTRRAPRGRTRERARPRRPEAARVDRARTREQSGRIRRRSSRRRPRRGEDTRLRGTRRRLARARDLAPDSGSDVVPRAAAGSAALAARQRARWFDAAVATQHSGPSAGSSSAPPRHRQHVPIESISRPFRATSGPSSGMCPSRRAASAASVASIASAASRASVASTNSSESSESSVSSVSSFARRNARCRAAICSITARCRAPHTSRGVPRRRRPRPRPSRTTASPTRPVNVGTRADVFLRDSRRRRRGKDASRSKRVRRVLRALRHENRRV